MLSNKIFKLVTVVTCLFISSSVFANLITEDLNVRLRSFGNTGGQELYLGVDDLGQSANRNAANYVWQQGANAFSLSFDGASVFELTLGNTSVSYTLGQDLSGKMLNALNVFVFSRDSGSSATLTSLAFGGNTAFANDLVGANWTPYVFDNLAISGAFTLDGVIELDGGFSNSQERSKVELQFGFVDAPSTATQVPAPSILSLMGMGLLVLLVRKTRKA